MDIPEDLCWMVDADKHKISGLGLDTLSHMAKDAKAGSFNHAFLRKVNAQVPLEQGLAAGCERTLISVVTLSWRLWFLQMVYGLQGFPWEDWLFSLEAMNWRLQAYTYHARREAKFMLNWVLMLAIKDRPCEGQRKRRNWFLTLTMTWILLEYGDINAPKRTAAQSPGALASGFKLTPAWNKHCLACQIDTD